MNTTVVSATEIVSGGQRLHPTDLQRLRQVLYWAGRHYRSLPPFVEVALILFAVPLVGFYSANLFSKIVATLILLLVGWVRWRDYRQYQHRNTIAEQLPDWILERAWNYVLDQYHCELINSVSSGLQTADAAIERWTHVPPSLRCGTIGTTQHFRDAEKSRFVQPHGADDVAAYVMGIALLHAISKEMLYMGLDRTEVAWVNAILPDLSGYARAGCPDA